MKPAICTQCGANIEVDETRDAGICTHCGTPFVTEKVINKIISIFNIVSSFLDILWNKFYFNFSFCVKIKIIFLSKLFT